jgi:tetratricopeptide (TPR) repeat protein
VRRIALTAILLIVTVAAGCSSGSSQKRGAEADEATAKAEEPTETGPSADELFRRGNEHLEGERWKEAIASYQKALDRDSGRWKVLLNLAIAQSSAGHFEEAVDSIADCLNRGGEGRPEVYYNLGNIYQRRGLYQQAIKAYRTSLAHADEPDVDTLVNIGSALTILDRRRQAEATYKKAQKLAPRDPRIQHGFALLLYHGGKFNESLDAFDQLQRMAPDYARAWYDESNVHMKRDDFKSAIDALETYLEIAPEGTYADKARELIKVYRKELNNPTPRDGVQ